MAELHLGQLFDSQQEAEQFVTSYCARNYHPVTQRHMVTVTSYNKKVKSRNRLPEELKYQQMRWECKHFGVFKSRGNNKREYECALANDCKFQISVTYNRLLGKFIVTTAVLDHDTHEVSESLYQLYSSHRKLSVEQKKEIDSMLLANAKPTLVAEVLTKEGMSVCMKDLYNRKQKLLKIGNDIDDAVLSALNHPHIISRRITDINNKFEVLFFQTYTQRKLFANFGEVIHIHAFKTYNLKFPLYTLLVVDNNGIDQPIAFGILVKEKPQHIANFLEIFKGLNDVSNVQCVIVDKELAEIDALTKSLPAKCVHICYFHILKAVDNHLSTLKLENEGECRKQFDLVLKSRNEDEFARKLNELAFLSPEFHSYMVQNWLPFKEKITLFGCKDLMHLQNRTDNRIESFHDILKQVTATSGITLNVLIENLLSLVAERAYESVQQNIDMGTKEAESTNSDLENYYRQFTDYAASLIGKEMDLASSKTYRILPSSDGKLLIRNVETQAIHEISGDRCSCNLPSNFGIPCHHLIATWRLTGETLFQPNYVANRWKREPEDHLDVSSTILASLSMTAAEFASASMSRIQRFNTTMDALKDVASAIADQKNEKFDDCMTAIALFKNVVAVGNVSALVDTLQTLNNKKGQQSKLLSRK